VVYAAVFFCCFVKKLSPDVYLKCIIYNNIKDRIENTCFIIQKTKGVGMNSSDRKADVELTINEFGNLIFKTSLLILKNKHDAEDVTQDVFYKYIVTDNEFASKEHKKAWLLKVCHNICKNVLRYKKIHTYVAYDEIAECIVGSRNIETKEAEEIIKLTNMSYDYKSVIILHYLEGYSVEETANILEITPAAVKKRLQRAREKLRITYERFFGEGVK